MTYKEYKPDALLTPYIETYWTACGFQGPKESHRILPDGCVDIILSLNSSAHFELIPFHPTIIGTMTTFCNGSYTNEVYLVGIRFRPAGFTAFCRVPIHEFTDKRIDLALVESLFDERFYGGLPEKETTTEVIRHIDSYFIRKLKDVFIPEARIVYAIELIRQSNGVLSPDEIAHKSCLSIRHFERKFKAAIGTSPKTFSKIVKFQHTCDYLRMNNDKSLLSAAIDCGYYDQAHLIKDFKALSGSTPSSFKL
ncbi:helix-turn-helix domain-containing protein [Bacteroides sp.]|uniref:helix-turn-helix domain-containing protein n=1 Tax=Bacteroides sp. TaxID=29523 RepID=UPI002626FAD3|nr:helix-turn-helix domain-containing protein [Bacteroides sp.]MDD3040241.1 helix-turn-helix domain-containing protein [Bacteroides sp.]